MPERISANTLSPVERVKVDDLTPMEKEALAAQGTLGPEGFVDIEKPEPPAMVDIHADARKKAVTDLNSVVGGASAKIEREQPRVDDSKALSEMSAELTKLQDKLKTRSPCPRCGLAIDEHYEVSPSKEDTAEFLRCVMAGTVYKRPYKLFGGALTVTLQTRTGAADELIRRVVNEAMRAREIVSDMEVFAAIRHYTLAASLSAYSSKATEILFDELPYDTPAAFRKAADERMAKLPSQIHGFLRPILANFNEAVDILTERAQDPSFWTGTPT
jgi:hypothetical protein